MRSAFPIFQYFNIQYSITAYSRLYAQIYKIKRRRRTMKMYPLHAFMGDRDVGVWIQGLGHGKHTCYHWVMLGSHVAQAGPWACCVAKDDQEILLPLPLKDWGSLMNSRMILYLLLWSWDFPSSVVPGWVSMQNYWLSKQQPLMVLLYHVMVTLFVKHFFYACLYV